MTEHGEWVAMTETPNERDARLVAELLTGAPPPELPLRPLRVRF